MQPLLLLRLVAACLSALLVASACRDPLDDARESLLGEWRGDSVIVNVVDSIQTPPDPASISLAFDGARASYRVYTTDSVGLVIGEGPYALTHRRENAGFTRVDAFSLDLDGIPYEVEFGDQTANAERDADEIRLLQTGEDGAPVVLEFVRQ